MPYPKFHLRDLFWLVLLLAVVLTAVLWRQRDVLTVGRYQQFLDKNGNLVTFDTATGQRWVEYGPGNRPVHYQPPWEQAGQ